MSVSESAGSAGSVWSGFCAQCEKLRGRYQAYDIKVRLWRGGHSAAMLAALGSQASREMELGPFDLGDGVRKSYEQIVVEATGPGTWDDVTRLLNAARQLLNDAGRALSKDACEDRSIPRAGDPAARFLAWVAAVLINAPEFVEHHRCSENVLDYTELRFPFEAMPEAVSRAGLLAESKPAKRKRRSNEEVELLVAKAATIVVNHPERSDRSIAQEVGLHPSVLTRHKLYSEAAMLARARRYVPPGYRDQRTGNIEAVARQPDE